MKQKMVFSLTRGSLSLVSRGGGVHVRVTWWRKEAVLFVTPFLTFPHPPTHVVRGSHIHVISEYVFVVQSNAMCRNLCCIKYIAFISIRLYKVNMYIIL